MHEDWNDKTLWTQTLIEILYADLQRPKDPATIRETVAGLRAKGYKTYYLIQKVRKDVGDDAAYRLERIVSPQGRTTLQ